MILMTIFQLITSLLVQTNRAFIVISQKRRWPQTQQQHPLRNLVTFSPLKLERHVNVLPLMDTKLNADRMINDSNESNDVKKTMDGSDELPINDKKVPSSIYTKIHSMTICMVPSPEYKDEWEKISKARIELRDPGLFRWPPHANILYPFYDILNPNISGDEILDDYESEIIDQTLNSLQNAVQQIEPFQVSIDELGTFGGSQRGVLYLIPRSFRDTLGNKNNDDYNIEPLIELQSKLEDNFPECGDQKKQGTYTPHMTLSHFPSLESALEGKEQIEKWWTPLTFDVNEVYVLKRKGDGGQFKILATLSLGSPSNKASSLNQNHYPNVIIHDPPLAFPDMPMVEEDWVYQERMKLKQRRNGRGNRRSRGGNKLKKRIDRGPSKSKDTPEEIAKKRAERAAKKERLAKEISLIEQAIHPSHKKSEQDQEL